MRYLNLPNTDLKASAICFGTLKIGSVIGLSDSFKLLDIFQEQGGNFLDTAKVYADWLPGERSTSEKAIGKWMRQKKNRDQIILATKGAHPELDGRHMPRLSRAEIISDLNDSLKNLQTETIDVYWLHRDDVDRPVDEIMETLQEQVTTGKIRYFGCSNWNLPRIRAAQAYANQRGGPGFIANQMLWSLAVVDPQSLQDPTMVAMDSKLKHYHLETGFAAIPYSSQANGWFQRKSQGTVPQMSRTFQQMYNHPINEERFRRARRLAEVRGGSLMEVVLGYLLSLPFPTIPIVGSRTADQLLDSLRAGDVRLSPEEVKYLEQGDALEPA